MIPIKASILFAHYKAEYEKHKHSFAIAMVLKQGLEYWRKELIKILN
jgi:hypothetical protein